MEKGHALVVPPGQMIATHTLEVLQSYMERVRAGETDLILVLEQFANEHGMRAIEFEEIYLMGTDPYVLIQTEDSFCPKCDNSVQLLTNGGKPAFYICFDCQFVGHVGIGQVEHRGLNDDNESV